MTDDVTWPRKFKAVTRCLWSSISQQLWEIDGQFRLTTYRKLHSSNSGKWTSLSKTRCACSRWNGLVWCVVNRRQSQAATCWVSHSGNVIVRNTDQTGRTTHSFRVWCLLNRLLFGAFFSIFSDVLPLLKECGYVLGLSVYLSVCLSTRWFRKLWTDFS